MKKKLMGLVLVAALAAMTVVGCGSSSSKAPETTPAADTQAVTTEAAAETTPAADTDAAETTEAAAETTPAAEADTTAAE